MEVSILVFRATQSLFLLETTVALREESFVVGCPSRFSLLEHVLNVLSS